MDGILDGEFTQPKPNRRDKKLAARAQRSLTEENAAKRNSLVKLYIVVGTLMAVIILAAGLDWYINVEQQKSYRDGQNHPNERVTQEICTEAYSVGVAGRDEPTAVAGTRGNNLRTTGEWCDYSNIPPPSTTKAK